MDNYWKEQKSLWFLIKLLLFGSCHGKSYSNNYYGEYGEKKIENSWSIKYKDEWYSVSISQVK